MQSYVDKKAEFHVAVIMDGTGGGRRGAACRAPRVTRLACAPPGESR